MWYVPLIVTVLSIVAIFSFLQTSAHHGPENGTKELMAELSRSVRDRIPYKQEYQYDDDQVPEQQTTWEPQTEIIKNLNGRCFVYNPATKVTKIGCPTRKIIRNFASDAVICYPEDLKEHHPRCECCGGWIPSDWGLKCSAEFLYDCSDDYKESRYRKTYPTVYSNDDSEEVN